MAPGQLHVRAREGGGGGWGGVRRGGGHHVDKEAGCSVHDTCDVMSKPAVWSL